MQWNLKIFPLGTALVALGLAFVQAEPVAAEPHAYSIDRAHSSVGFEVRHFFNQVPGRFTQFDGEVIYDPEAPEQSSVHLVVEAESVQTDLERRDQHLRSEDFFAVEEFPRVTFSSTSVKRTGEKTFDVTGDFTLRGKTKRMTVPVELLGIMTLGPGVAKAGFQTEFVIDRKEFGVSWNRKLDQGGTILGDEVTIEIVLQLDRRAAEEATDGTADKTESGP